MSRDLSDLKSRWRTLRLLDPVYELINRSAPRAEFDHNAYDLAQLALRLVDFVVVNQASLEGSVSPAAVVDHLTQAARRMHPDDPQRAWTKVSRLVFGTVLNDGRPHRATWVEPAPHDSAPSTIETYRYRLLRLGDGEDGPAVTATDESIVLYLQALSTDLADRALALKLMVAMQMEAGEFAKALTTAREATRTANGLAATLRERLDSTRRDVRTVDWTTDMPAWLRDVLTQVRQQIDHDRRLRDLATRAAEDPDAAEACRAIDAEVKQGERRWLVLEGRMQQAIPVFLAAQETQRLRPHGLARAVDLTRDLLQPALAAEDAELDDATDLLAAGALAPVVPQCWGVDELCAVLLRAPAVVERHDPEIDDPGELGDAGDGSVPHDVARCLAELLAPAGEGAVRLSELLRAARARTADVTDPKRLLDLLWGAALWAFVNGGEGLTEEHGPVAAWQASGLAAIDDGVVLDDDRFRGADLVLATPAVLDQIDLDTLGAA